MRFCHSHYSGINIKILGNKKKAGVDWEHRQQESQKEAVWLERTIDQKCLDEDFVSII
jgi:hypothetical protein